MVSINTANFRNLPKNQDEYSDEDFFKGLNFKIRELNLCKKAVDQKDWHGAVKEYILYLNHKKNSWPGFQAQNLSRKNVLLADKITQGYLYEKLTGGEIKFHPYAGNIDAFKGQLKFRTEFLRILLDAYSKTEYEKYAKTLIKIFREFIHLNPFRLDTSFHPNDFAVCAPGYNQLGLPYITFRLINLIHHPLFHSKHFSTMDQLFFIKHLYFYMAFHLRFLQSAYRRDNHFMMERGVAPFVFGVLFPEFKGFDRLLEYGRNVIRMQCDENILPDGGQMEHCNAYHNSCLGRFTFPLSVAKVNGVNLYNRQQMKKVEQCMEFKFYSAKPDGTNIDLGDGRGGNVQNPYSQIAPIFKNGFAKFAAKKMGFNNVNFHPFFAKEYKNVKPIAPSVTSKIYPNSGYVFFRDNWETSSNFLGVSALTDSFFNIHLHWDTFGFFLHTNGKTLIGEPMSELYGVTQGKSARQKRESRGFYIGMKSHSTLIVNEDELKSDYALGDNYGYNGIRCNFINSHLAKDFDYVHLRHRSYEPIIHDSH